MQDALKIWKNIVFLISKKILSASQMAGQRVFDREKKMDDQHSVCLSKRECIRPSVKKVLITQLEESSNWFHKWNTTNS